MKLIVRETPIKYKNKIIWPRWAKLIVRETPIKYKNKIMWPRWAKLIQSPIACEACLRSSYNVRRSNTLRQTYYYTISILYTQMLWVVDHYSPISSLFLWFSKLGPGNVTTKINKKRFRKSVHSNITWIYRDPSQKGCRSCLSNTCGNRTGHRTFIGKSM